MSPKNELPLTSSRMAVGSRETSAKKETNSVFEYRAGQEITRDGRWWRCWSWRPARKRHQVKRARCHLERQSLSIMSNFRNDSCCSFSDCWILWSVEVWIVDYYFVTTKKLVSIVVFGRFESWARERDNCARGATHHQRGQAVTWSSKGRGLSSGKPTLQSITGGLRDRRAPGCRQHRLETADHRCKVASDSKASTEAMDERT